MVKIFFLIFYSINFSFASISYEDFSAKEFRVLPNTLTVQIIPSSYRLEWTTPRSLLWSLLKNQYWFPITKSSLGHITAELNCTTNKNKTTKLMGQSVVDINAFRDKLQVGYGFSILNRPNLYQDLPLVNVEGKLDEPSKLKARFDKLIQKDHLFVVSFKINEQDCLSALNFMYEYEEKTKTTKTAGNIYGFGADPLKFEGAGCAPFVQATLNLAGLHGYAHIMEKTVYVSDKLLGRRDQQVSPLSLVFTSERIDTAGEDRRKFSFPDPQNLFDYFLPIFQGEKASKLPVLKKGFIGKTKARYILLDGSGT